MRKIELMPRYEAETLANKMCQDCPECEYVVFGWQRKDSRKPVFFYPLTMTEIEVSNEEGKYKDIYKIRNPYHDFNNANDNTCNDTTEKTIREDRDDMKVIKESSGEYIKADPSYPISSALKHWVPESVPYSNWVYWEWYLHGRRFDTVVMIDLRRTRRYPEFQAKRGKIDANKIAKEIEEYLAKDETVSKIYKYECKVIPYGNIWTTEDDNVFQISFKLEVTNMKSFFNECKLEESHKEKKLYRYEGALLDMSLDKPFAYTNKAYYVNAYSPKQAILLVKKEIAKDMNMDVDDFHLTQLNLYEVPDVEEEEEFYEVDFDTCPLCGHKLNDGGACPICDDGEEEYECLTESAKNKIEDSTSVDKALNELNKKTEAFSYDEMTPNFDISLLDNWISRLNEYEKSKGYSFEKIYDYTVGKKYIKVFFSYGSTGKSVFAFVDADGNIYKPAGWNNPAKGVRARIDENPPLDGGDLYAKKYW